eukprot:Clim_evm33s221 gene=Clim_evmTU33s221
MSGSGTVRLYTDGAKFSVQQLIKRNMEEFLSSALENSGTTAFGSQHDADESMGRPLWRITQADVIATGFHGSLITEGNAIHFLTAVEKLAGHSIQNVSQRVHQSRTICRFLLDVYQNKNTEDIRTASVPLLDAALIGDEDNYATICDTMVNCINGLEFIQQLGLSLNKGEESEQGSGLPKTELISPIRESIVYADLVDKSCAILSIAVHRNLSSNETVRAVLRFLHALWSSNGCRGRLPGLLDYRLVRHLRESGFLPQDLPAVHLINKIENVAVLSKKHLDTVVKDVGGVVYFIEVFLEAIWIPVQAVCLDTLLGIVSEKLKRGTRLQASLMRNLGQMCDLLLAPAAIELVGDMFRDIRHKNRLVSFLQKSALLSEINAKADNKEDLRMLAALIYELEAAAKAYNDFSMLNLPELTSASSELWSTQLRGYLFGKDAANARRATYVVGHVLSLPRPLYDSMEEDINRILFEMIRRDEVLYRILYLNIIELVRARRHADAIEQQKRRLYRSLLAGLSERISQFVRRKEYDEHILIRMAFILIESCTTWRKAGNRSLNMQDLTDAPGDVAAATLRSELNIHTDWLLYLNGSNLRYIHDCLAAFGSQHRHIRILLILMMATLARNGEAFLKAVGGESFFKQALSTNDQCVIDVVNSVFEQPETF